MTPALIIANGVDEPTVLPLDGGIVAGMEPGHIVLGYAGDRMITLDLTGVPDAWPHALVKELWHERWRAIAARHGLPEVRA